MIRAKLRSEYTTYEVTSLLMTPFKIFLSTSAGFHLAMGETWHSDDDFFLELCKGLSLVTAVFIGAWKSTCNWYCITT